MSKDIDCRRPSKVNIKFTHSSFLTRKRVDVLKFTGHYKFKTKDMVSFDRGWYSFRRNHSGVKASKYEPKIEVQSISNYGKDELTYVISNPDDFFYLQSIGPGAGIDMIVIPEYGEIHLRNPKFLCLGDKWSQIFKTDRREMLPLYDINFGKGFKRYNPYSVSEDLRSSNDELIGKIDKMQNQINSLKRNKEIPGVKGEKGGDLEALNDKLTGKISKLETKIKKLESGKGDTDDKLAGRISKLETKIKKLESGKGDTDDKLTGRISKLETKIKKLESGKTAPSGKGDTDEITGLDARVASLEDFVKIDRKQLPSSNPNAGIGYFIHRNYADIQSNISQFDSIFKRLATIEADITNNYAEFLQHRSVHNSNLLAPALDTI